jgi:hypothetical protein
LPIILTRFRSLARGRRHWHFVNVKYRRDADAGSSVARRVLRRIAIGPHERLRTAAERVAMLDLTTLSPNLFGLAPLAIQQRHDEAFDVEAVTQAFFTTYRAHFEAVESRLTGLDSAEDARLFTQRLFNRLLFIVFLERKGWLIPPDGGSSPRLTATWPPSGNPTVILQNVILSAAKNLSTATASSSCSSPG